MNLIEKNQLREISLYQQKELLWPSGAEGSTALVQEKIKEQASWIARQASITKRISSSLLFAVFVVLYLLPLTGHPLFIPDETRYAEVPQEMITTGDWIVPRINGLRYFEKPVMGYWLTAASIKAFGEKNVAVRLPAALSTLAVILIL